MTHLHRLDGEERTVEPSASYEGKISYWSGLWEEPYQTYEQRSRALRGGRRGRTVSSNFSVRAAAGRQGVSPECLVVRRHPGVLVELDGSREEGGKRLEEREALKERGGCNVAGVVDEWEEATAVGRPLARSISPCQKGREGEQKAHVDHPARLRHDSAACSVPGDQPRGLILRGKEDSSAGEASAARDAGGEPASFPPLDAQSGGLTTQRRRPGRSGW